MTENNQKAFWDYNDIYNQAEFDVVMKALKYKRGDRFKLSTVTSYQLNTVWESFMKHGKVLKVEPLNAIQQTMIYNTCVLSIMTQGMGHSTHWPFERWKDIYEFTDGQIRKIKFVFLECYDWALWSNGQYFVSDYGLPKLEELSLQVLQEKIPEKRLVLLDKMLNVVHQRSDLAELFVEDGSNTLSLLSGTL